ncbi:hypothetical protein [Streptomyces sp. NBC_00829]|uniref:hypothetical protein n=1 Tax=Streptomyces sp. NBC_00829 TaxID=2903679 RepID=UPI00386876AA|nr:hypothetical protein OG293_00390 [Streptomyces sp. NBC_00829]WTB19042.1 hypothetical protein OG293_39145 [Streptomyces sp. NBC_00829]
MRVAPGAYELTWAPDRRAAWSYGRELRHGRHIVWRRIGTHSILTGPWPGVAVEGEGPAAIMDGQHHADWPYSLGGT